MFQIPLLITIAILLSAAAFMKEAAADLSLSDALALEQEVTRFLCEKDSFCPEKKIQISGAPPAGHSGYFHNGQNRISLAEGLNRNSFRLALVHEYSHAYRTRFNPKETMWLNEGIAKFMEFRYSGVWPEKYVERLHENPVLSFGTTEEQYSLNSPNYGSAFFLFLFLYNHLGGEDFLRMVMASPLSGWHNVVSSGQALSRLRKTAIPIQLINKETLLRHFAMALWLNDPSLAKYSLFFLDSRYRPLSHLEHPQSMEEASRPPQTSEGLDAEIAFTRAPTQQASCEAYSLWRGAPPVFRRWSSEDKADAYLCVRYFGEEPSPIR